MSWQPDYVTAEQLKAHLRVTDAADDVPILLALQSASRAIDHACGRQFGLENSAVDRYYTYDPGLFLDCLPAVQIDDLASNTDLVVSIDEDGSGDYATELVEGTDYTLWPPNAELDARPYTHLLTRSTSAYRWARYANGVKVTGIFGWFAVPDTVEQACLIQAARFFVRRDSSYGIAGSPELGNELRLLDRLDPDVALLLTSVKRHWGAV